MIFFPALIHISPEPYLLSLFFTVSPHFFHTSFCLLFCGSGLVMAFGLSFIIFSCEWVSPLCHPYYINVPPPICLLRLCASPRVSSSVSQNIFCYIVSLKVHPWGWESPLLMKCYVWETINVIFLLCNRCSINFFLDKQKNEWVNILIVYTNMYFGNFLSEKNV